MDPEIERAASLLKAGELVAFPTETVYGLGADATNAAAVVRVFAAKARPVTNPLIVHVADVAAARRLVRFDDRAERLAARFWPGALTLVLPRSLDCPVADQVGAGVPTLAIRVPAHPLAQALLVAVGRPITAPSANPTGDQSPTTAGHVRHGLGAQVALILDGGPCRIGVESTLVGLTEPTARLLRPGAVPAAEIEAVIGPLATAGG